MILEVGSRDVNKDLTPKDQDKGKDLTPKDQDKDKDLTHKDQDKDKDLTLKDQDKDKDLKYGLKESLRTRTRTRINIPETRSSITVILERGEGFFRRLRVESFPHLGKEQIKGIKSGARYIQADINIPNFKPHALILIS